MGATNGVERLGSRSSGPTHATPPVLGALGAEPLILPFLVPLQPVPWPDAHEGLGPGSVQVRGPASGSALPLAGLGFLASLLTAPLEFPIYFLFPLEQGNSCGLQ